MVLSEASGAEESPVPVETPEYSADTLELDRIADAFSGSTITPSRINKVTRYGKHGHATKKQASGKGSIRSQRDPYVVLRKRKRHNHDRDVGSVSRYHQAQDSEPWDSDSNLDSDNSSKLREPSWSQRRDKKQSQMGAFESFFHALNKYPNTPDHMQRWMQFGANLLLVSVVAYLGWMVVSTVRADISKANEMARQELMSKMAECQTQYTLNECSKKDRPALRMMCDEWYDCMMQNPESILRIKVTAKQVAEIINEFSEAMNLKAWVRLFSASLALHQDWTDFFG